MFVFVNYSDRQELQQFHSTVIGIDSDDLHAPFPSLFIIHEMRVRGFHLSNLSYQLSRPLQTGLIQMTCGTTKRTYLSDRSLLAEANYPQDENRPRLKVQLQVQALLTPTS